MEVIRANTAGFCMGVSLALTRLEKLVADRDRENPGEKIYTLGPIIHNPQLVHEYEERNVWRIDNVDEAAPGATIVIRAHGIPKKQEVELKAKGFNVVDATCPRVKKAQLSIRKAVESGAGELLLFGEAEHPEVKGLLSYAGKGSIVFGSLEEAFAMKLPDGGKFFLAAQTTQDRNVFETIAEHLMNKYGQRLLVLKTICDATKERQQEVISLCKRVKSMVIVGGMNSGNTRRLAEIASSLGVLAIHCEDSSSIPVESLRRLQPVGLSAGASTPDKYINQVEQFLANN